MKITFLGAAGTVTGSKYLLETTAGAVMIDAGMFQGRKELRRRNWEPLPVDPAGVDAAILTHAHIDHSGYLPRLARDGFRGPVFATHATRELASILLADSAHIQEEHAAYMNRKRVTKHRPALPLYTTADADYAVRKLRGLNYGEPFEPLPGVTAVFHDAGHILGSSWVEIETEGRRIIFSGDLGRRDAPILRDPEPPSRADILVVESTYGNRLHGGGDVAEELAETVRETVRKKGVLVIPAFAVERTQEILYILSILKREEEIPNIPLFLDSPLAIKTTRIFEKYHEIFDREATRALEASPTLLEEIPNLKFTSSVEESKAIAEARPPFIVISASGMADAGRILHHLRHYLPGEKNTVLLVGYQVEGSRGHRLLDGEKEIKIFGDYVEVRASIGKIDGFSGHADYPQLMDWISGIDPPPETTFLTHGNPSSLEAQRVRISEKGWKTHVPRLSEGVDLA